MTGSLKYDILALSVWTSKIITYLMISAFSFMACSPSIK